MRRRQFITTAAASGAGLSLFPFDIFGTGFQDPVDFLTEKGNPQMLFPTPPDGFTLGITPPGLAWYPAPGAAAYRIEIRKEYGNKVYSKDIPNETVHLPDRTLDPGRYRWNVFALDKQNRIIADRGEKTFIISDNPGKLPWIAPSELLSMVPKEHSRIIFLKSKMPEYRQRLATSHQSVLTNLLKQAESQLNIGLPPLP